MSAIWRGERRISLMRRAYSFAKVVLMSPGSSELKVTFRPPSIMGLIACEGPKRPATTSCTSSCSDSEEQSSLSHPFGQHGIVDDAVAMVDPIDIDDVAVPALHAT